MQSKLDRYKKDLLELLKKGENLHSALQYECLPKEFEKLAEKEFGEKASKFISDLPSFTLDYQSWYSEVIILIKQLMPDRLSDFIRHYEKPKARKEISYENYMIEDCLQGLTITRGYPKEKVLGREAAIPHFTQQLAILRSVTRRFESSLFDIRQLVQADLFDSELDAARELSKQGFARAAGALAGVVLERHLAQVCDNHNLKIAKKTPCIGDFNETLKGAEVIDVPQWRFIQHLAGIRNLCDHNKESEPTEEQVNDLISGVAKITKTLF